MHKSSLSIIHKVEANDWQYTFLNDTQHQAVTELEKGKILLLPHLAFLLLDAERGLLNPLLVDAKTKNLSLNINTMRIGGLKNLAYEKLLKDFLHRYALATQNLIHNLFPGYKEHIQWGRTSFRPVEIEGRKAPSFRKDDTRLHVDAFPASPNQGKRILRVFTNIHPEGKTRLWKVGEPFEAVAQQFLPGVRKPWLGRGKLLKALKITRGFATDYDYTMLQIHNNMKGDLQYQSKAQQQEIEFKPGSTWIVQTDHVSHAALKGQHVLEQTFYLPIEAMHNPSLSPLKTLERLMGKELA